jgi:hypothetical protein
MNERGCANKFVQVSKPKKSVGLWRGLELAHHPCIKDRCSYMCLVYRDLWYTLQKLSTQNLSWLGSPQIGSKIRPDPGQKMLALY